MPDNGNPWLLPEGGALLKLFHKSYLLTNTIIILHEIVIHQYCIDKMFSFAIVYFNKEY